MDEIDYEELSRMIAEEIQWEFEEMRRMDYESKTLERQER